MFTVFDNLGLRSRFAILLGIFLLGFSFFGAWSFKTLNALQVNGPLFQRIAKNKDLVADILPPPAYIIESYLTVVQLSAATDDMTRDTLIQTLSHLQKEYNEAHNKWKASDLGADLDDVFIHQADQSAQAFYQGAATQLVPAVQAQDRDAIARAMQQLEAVYAAHRKAIDATVEKVNKLVEQDQTDAQSRIESATRLLSAILLASVAASLGVAVLIIRSIVKPLAEAVQAAQTFASGDLNAQLEPQGEHEFAQLLRAMRDMQHKLSALVSRVRMGSESLDTASGEISQGNMDLSERTERQAGALQNTAASMEQLSAQVRLNADSAREANQLARNASQMASQGGGVVVQVVETMKGIDAQSRKIAEITGVIDSIAFQTNILALNAAVEAARAGEEGRGFAVVASEVRALASRSADAARQIKGLIANSVERAQKGAAMADQAGVAMREVVESIQHVSDKVGTIAAASAEQSLGVKQVSDAVAQMDQVTQQNAALVEEMANAAKGLKQQAGELVSQVSAFRLAPKGRAQLRTMMPALIAA